MAGPAGAHVAGSPGRDTEVNWLVRDVVGMALLRRFIVEDVLQGGGLGFRSQIREKNRLASYRLHPSCLSESGWERSDAGTRVHHHCLLK